MLAESHRCETDRKVSSTASGMILSSNWPKLGYWFSCSSHRDCPTKTRAWKALFDAKELDFTLKIPNGQYWKWVCMAAWQMSMKFCYVIRNIRNWSSAQGYLSPLPPGSRHNLPKHILCFYRVIKHFEWEFSRVRKNMALKIAYEILYLQLSF